MTKIQCDCGKTMEDTGKKIEIETPPDIDIFSLFACQYCGDQALFKKLEEDEYYEL